MIYCKTSGTGTPVVLLHGYGENHSLWDDLTKRLSTTFQVITPDLPGFGESKRLPGKFSLDDVAKAIFNFLTEELKLSEFVILGHSLGGYVALSLAEQHPEHILGLGLINSSALSDSPEKKDNRLKTAEFILKYSASFFLNNFVPNLFYEANREKLAQQINQVQAMGQNLNEKLMADYMLAMKDRSNRLHILAEYEHALFIGGAQDSGFTSADFEIQINVLKNPSNGHVLPNIGHMSMYEAQEELYTISSNFLKSI